MMNTDIEKEIRSAMEGIKEFKHGVDIIGARLSDIDDRLSEPAYSKEFVDEFKDCCYRLVAPESLGGISMSHIVCTFNLYTVPKILKSYSAEEIVAKFRELDKKKKFERAQTFHIGDEVQHIYDDNIKGVVIKDSSPDSKIFTIWMTNGNVMAGVAKDLVSKTGRHFDSIDYWIEKELRKEEK